MEGCVLCAVEFSRTRHSVPAVRRPSYPIARVTASYRMASNEMWRIASGVPVRAFLPVIPETHFFIGPDAGSVVPIITRIGQIRSVSGHTLLRPMHSANAGVASQYDSYSDDSSRREGKPRKILVLTATCERITVSIFIQHLPLAQMRILRSR